MKKFKKSLIALLCMLLTLGCLTACGGGGGDAESEEASDQIVWSFYTAYGPEDGACCEIWTQLADQVYEETDGKLKIEIYWYGQHPYEDTDMLKVVKDGTCQMSNFYSQYAEAVEPALAIEGQPLMFPTDPNEAYAILQSLWGNFEQDTSGAMEAILQENWNATLVHCMPAGPQTLLTNGYEAVTADSLKGHKIRVQGEATSEFVQALGGTPVSISLGDVYTSLSTNLIDGLITSPLFGYNYGVFDHVDTLNMWRISSATDGIMVNLDALNALPEDVKETFLRIMRESAQKPESLEVDMNNDIIDNTLVPDGATVIEPTPEVREEIRSVLADSTWQKWLETSGENGQKVYDQVQTLME